MCWVCKAYSRAAALEQSWIWDPYVGKLEYEFGSLCTGQEVVKDPPAEERLGTSSDQFIYVRTVGSCLTLTP